MAQDDGTVSQMLVAAYRVYDGINTVILPVQGIHIPLDRVIAAFRSGLYDIIIIITVRRAEEEHFITGKILHFFMYLHKFLFFVTRQGIAKRVVLSDLQNIRRAGLRALNLNEDDALVDVRRVWPSHLQDSCQPIPLS